MIATLVDKVQYYLSKTPFSLALSDKEQSRVCVSGIEGFPLAVMVSSLCKEEVQIGSRIWVITPTVDDLSALCKDLDTIGQAYIQLQGTGTSFYSEYLYDDIDYAERGRSLLAISNSVSGIVVSTLRDFVSPVVSKSTLSTSCVLFNVKDHVDTSSLSERLVDGGYIRVPRTTVPGEFSIRGEVIDIFPYDEHDPIRIFLEFDLIEKMAHFDALTQDTFERIDRYELLLMRQESKLALNDQTSSIDTYFTRSDLFMFHGDQRLETSFRSLQAEAKSQFRSAYAQDAMAARPDELVFDYHVCTSDAYRSIIIEDIKGQEPEAYQIDIIGPRSYFGDLQYFKEELGVLTEQGYHIVVFAGSQQQVVRLEALIQLDEVIVSPKEISGGFSIPSSKIIAICDHEIFGRRRRAIKTISQKNLSPLDSFVDLNTGDYIVHLNYGVGRFELIDRIRAAGKERDYIKILYSGDEYVFIPIEQANLLQRFIGSDNRPPKLDKLGGQSWETKKAKARKSAEDLAKRLIDLYARRKQVQGFAFPKDTDWQVQFEAMFPYEETEDQLSCLADIKDDMEHPIVMDRLICGDVGYGKTEIAIRAIFKAVMAGKQAALLAPTTILVEQHYDTIMERVKDFPLRIAMLSRLKSRQEQKVILRQLQQGSIDVIVGTHRIIQKDILFHDLGLLVIDEEQRFGVKDKERIKEMKASIDCLALSATPIPRTLYMSLLKIRDMSLLTTPPYQRRPIKTFIQEFNQDILIQAIKREISRGGQVFYLHNRIESLDRVVVMLQELLPDLTIEFAHGQMDPEMLEDRMRRFIHRGAQILVATTIIENGIDIPNVNTIIIDRADMYGVSQLYQLRGRVGRSDKDAFAYLFYPERYALSEIAMKRLKILSEHTELGAGFKIAMKDMEMRGTGNLLGREQSGQMQAVGLDMYLRILDEAISELRDDKKEERSEVFLDLDYSGYIPDSYIDVPSIKFDIYRKIATIDDEVSLQNLTSEMNDRFGPIPEEVLNLLYITELKIVCKKISVYHLQERNGKVRVEFSKVADIAIHHVLNLIRESKGSVTIDQKNPHIMVMKTEAISLKDKALFILERLQRLV